VEPPPLASLAQDDQAPRSLKAVSLPPGNSIISTATYAYQRERLGQVRIYILDSGATVSAKVSLRGP
jgi:hypothetical protein